MEHGSELKSALSGIEQVRRTLVNYLERGGCPDLQALSVAALSVQEPGSPDHLRKLAAYLMQSSPALGKLPVEALIEGQGDAVVLDLVQRGQLSSRSPDVKDSGPKPPATTTKANPVHAAYCRYFATGEGATVLVALASSAEHARTLFLDSAPEYFHRGLEVLPVADLESEAAWLHGWFPQPVIDAIATRPPGTTELFFRYHSNLA